MKNYYAFLFLLIVSFACTKSDDTSVISSLNISASKGGGGGNNNTGFIQSVISGTASKLIGTHTDSILVSFTQTAPAGGWTLQLTSSDPSAVQVPATYFVPEGSFTVFPHVTAGSVANAKNVTITVKLLSQTKTTVLKVFPFTATFPAPQLQTPGNGSGINFRTQIKFDWNDNSNAYYYHLQISTDKAFTDLVADIETDQSIWAQDYFNGTGTRYWRVAFVDAGGNLGPWSEVRSFVEKPQ